MSNLKTYTHVNPQQEEISFGISRMEEVYARRQGKVDLPHRHDFYTVLVIDQAQGEHKIDFNRYDLGPGQIYFVSPGQVHQIIEQAPSIGFAMTFSTAFLIQNDIRLSFIEGLNLFHDYGHSPPLLPSPDQLARITPYTQQIFELYQGNADMKLLSIGAFVKLLLIECNNICAMNPLSTDADPSGSNLIKDYKAMVELHYKKEHSTSFYAAALHVSPDHLNRTIKSKIGKTAKHFLQTRISTEAKRLLYFSSLTAKEIGYTLGFDEPAHFSAFFKKCTGTSPTLFRKNTTQPQDNPRDDDNRLL